MTYVRRSNRFTDPKNGFFYDWPINHETEDPVPNSRQMSDGAPTSNIGLLPQQGVPVPLKPTWHGKIYTQLDKDKMDAWFQLCESQTIYLTDFNGSQWEILIEDFPVNRKAVGWNKRGQIPWIWEYSLTFRILRVISGEYTGRTP